ncbi:MAG: choice-of-anchor K domain-containing protein [Verrucomicrobiota bacterium]
MPTFNPFQKCKRPGCAGFTLVELVLSVGVIGILAGLAVMLLGGARAESERTLLDHQVRELNAAVKVYLASGGSFDEDAELDEVIAKLKTRAHQDQQVVGFSGSVVDKRLTPVWQESNEASSSERRVVWSADKAQFEFATTGPGVKRFALLAATAMQAGDAQEVREQPVVYASEDNWVWDFSESAAPLGPIAPANEETTPAGTPGGGGSISTPGNLLPPVISPSTGEWAYEDFPLTVSIAHPNPTGSSVLHYKLGEGDWSIYSGPILVGPSVEVRAFCQTANSQHWENSIVVSERYESLVQRFSGSASGRFRDAEGPTDMVYEILEEGSRFEYGLPYSAGGFDEPNSLVFTGAEFSEVRPDERFKLGTLDYFNGTIYSLTEAQQVTLDVTVDFTVPAVTETFSFDLELESTTNYYVSLDDDADFVRMGNLSSDFQTTLNGKQYRVELQFGYEGENGFATVSEFHVHEGKSASGDIYATFIEIESEEESEPEDGGGTYASPCGLYDIPPGLPAYSPLSISWVKHWNGTGSTEWSLTNPNSVPLNSTPDTKIRYNLTVYDDYHALGNVLQSAEGWDNGNPNPLNSAYAKSLKVEWYLVIGGIATEILGCDIANADGVPLGGQDEEIPDPEPQPEPGPTPEPEPSPQDRQFAAHTLPGRIEAEDYDTDGAGQAYVDPTSGNSGGSYRDEDVDVEGSSEGAYNVGWIANGEWQDYTVEATPGRYNIHVRVASAQGDPGNLSVALAGQTLATFEVPGTGGWQSWTTLSVENVQVDASGFVELRLNHGGGYNVNWIEFEEMVPEPEPELEIAPLRPLHSYDQYSNSIWIVENDNINPVISNPHTRLKFNWRAYKRGQVVASGQGRDQSGSVVIWTPEARRFVVEWYTEANGVQSEILGTATAIND